VCELNESEWLYLNSLESVRGFLIYVSRTYRPMIHFLLGMHHTLDSWRPNWEDGWRQNRMMMSMECYVGGGGADHGSDSDPNTNLGECSKAFFKGPPCVYHPRGT
jgi:hypothetical protein